jgi:hypothetical protein
MVTSEYLNAFRGPGDGAMPIALDARVLREIGRTIKKPTEGAVGKDHFKTKSGERKTAEKE